jgi:predicted DNA-binding transcriptional regulator AlpA
MEPGRPLSLKEIAHALGVSERTVRRMVSARQFPPPAHTPGGRPVWFEGDVEVYRYLVARGLFAPGEPPAIPEEDEDE